MATDLHFQRRVGTAKRWIIGVWAAISVLGFGLLGYGVYSLYDCLLFQQRYRGAAVQETTAVVEADQSYRSQSRNGRSTSSRYITYRYAVTESSGATRQYVRQQHVFNSYHVGADRRIPILFLTDRPHVAGVVGDEIELNMTVLPFVISAVLLVVSVGPAILVWRHKRRQARKRLPGSQLDSMGVVAADHDHRRK